MTREQKYPSTTSFKFYNANPKGRITTDCVIRAITVATGKDYGDVVRELAEWQIKTGYDDADKKGYGAYLEANGFVKKKQPRKPDDKKYTGKEFVKNFKGTCVANIGGNHVVAIKDGRVWDIWDSTGKTIGNYWIKP